MYELADYAAQRLNNTVVMCKGIPVYLQHRDGWTYKLFSIMDAKSTEKDIRKADISLEPVRLGYINSNGRSVYASRVPARRWKQGLSGENLIVSSNEGEAINGAKYLSRPEMAMCILNEYPTIKHLLKYLRLGTSGAFSREFCLKKKGMGEFTLYYKTKEVGSIEDRKIYLKPKFQYLSELVKEAIK